MDILLLAEPSREVTSKSLGILRSRCIQRLLAQCYTLLMQDALIESCPNALSCNTNLLLACFCWPKKFLHFITGLVPRCRHPVLRGTSSREPTCHRCQYRGEP